MEARSQQLQITRFREELRILAVAVAELRIVQLLLQCEREELVVVAQETRVPLRTQRARRTRAEVAVQPAAIRV